VILWCIKHEKTIGSCFASYSFCCGFLVVARLDFVQQSRKGDGKVKEEYPDCFGFYAEGSENCEWCEYQEECKNEFE